MFRPKGEPPSGHFDERHTALQLIQSDTKKRELLKNAKEIEEIQEKKNY